uniref:Uncharacterized protein n=1 Tax=Triticum urartu TaxID=4572 RepID=A0A8R7U8N9_TRIUA
MTVDESICEQEKRLARIWVVIRNRSQHERRHQTDEGHRSGRTHPALHRLWISSGEKGHQILCPASYKLVSRTAAFVSRRKPNLRRPSPPQHLYNYSHTPSAALAHEPPRRGQGWRKKYQSRWCNCRLSRTARPHRPIGSSPSPARWGRSQDRFIGRDAAPPSERRPTNPYLHAGGVLELPPRFTRSDGHRRRRGATRSSAEELKSPP